MEVVARTVARRPAHRAVEAPDASLTYAELDRLSNQLARRLLSLGVARDSCVGISLPRGAGELVAMLATLKAGGAYLPLDPSHPPDRLQMVLEDAAPQVVIVHPGSPFADAGSGRNVIVLDGLARVTEGHDQAPVSLSCDPAQLAYVLFTSGSTGRPKGVEISRGAFANFLRAMTHEPGLQETDRLLAVSTTSFDIAGLELFLPLCVGGTSVIADRATVIDPRRLRHRLEEDSITVMQATPATWRLLLEAGWQGHAQLRMLCGGEAMSHALAERLVRCGSELWNMYGPTETTVWSSVRRIPAGFDRIDIGKPIDRTQFWILDAERKLLPAGEVGELFIGGRGLARGYRGRPDLTADRFIQNPHGPAGDRIYRTGDLGRMLSDGSFDCLGRVDHQVKIRGYRIELGEIEAVLREVADVREVVVVADERDGEPRLVAYWVGGAERQALLEAARRRLPPYMLPSSYVPLEAFPLTPNGKIDRKSLPRAEAVEQDASALKRPSDDAETRVAAVWASVLGVDQVGVDQDFFSLGGTSVLAIEVCARIDKEMGLEIPLASFFESPTVEGLARYVARAREVSSPDSPIVVDLRRGAAGREPLFCLMGVHLYQDLALTLTDDRPVIGMHLPFRYIPATDPRPTVTEMAAGYLQLIRRRQPHGPYHLAGLCFGGIVSFEVARQLEAQGEEVALVVVFDGMLPGALRIDQVRRLTSYLRNTVREPRRAGAILRGKLEGMLARRAWLRRFIPAAPRAETPSTVPIDVEIEGREADAEIERYAAGLTAIAGRLLSIRALTQDLSDWVELAPHLGWEGLSPRLVIGDVAATHLGLLREPHVQAVARMITDALEKDSSALECERPSAAASG